MQQNNLAKITLKTKHIHEFIYEPGAVAVVSKSAFSPSTSKKVPRPGGEPGIFLFFIYFLSFKQCLRPLGHCAPHLSILKPFMGFFIFGEL